MSPLENITDIKKRLDKVSPYFCLAKWVEVSLHLQIGYAHSCHHPKTHKVPLSDFKNNPAVLHNTRHKKAVRKQMLKGIKPKECAYCWDMERIGKSSDRYYQSLGFWAEPYFDDILKVGFAKDINPKYLEVSFDNVCNFKCLYCSPENSSSLFAEYLKFGCYPTAGYFNNFYNWLKWSKLKYRILSLEKNKNPYVEVFWRWWPDLVKDLRVFRINGGEPLLSKHTWRALDYFSENPKPDLEVAVNSNLGVSREAVKELVSRINSLQGKIKNFTLYTSVDTSEKQVEYIRQGLNYADFINNIEYILNHTSGNISLEYMITVNVLSLAGLKNLLEVIQAQRQKYTGRKIINLDTHFLQHPKCLAINILTEDFAVYFNRVLEYMNSLPGKDGCPGFTPQEISRMERLKYLMLEAKQDFSLKKERKNFYLMIKEHDKRRGINFLKVFPEYYDFWNLCKNVRKK